MKVFISHKSDDARLARQIAAELSTKHQIESYLDVIDPYLGRRGEDLADYIRGQMSKCTQLLAVISPTTKSSQWVPWEIGVASEKRFPLATYSTTALTPEFLEKWPVLKSSTDLDSYARASKAARRRYTIKKSDRLITEASAKRSALEVFYSELRSSLG